MQTARRAPSFRRRLLPGGGRRDPYWRRRFVCERPWGFVWPSVSDRSGLKRLQNGRHNAARELGAQPLERIRLLSKKRRRIDSTSGLVARRVIFLAEYQAGVVPDDHVGLRVAQLDPRNDRDRITRGELVRVDARGNDRHRDHLTGEQAIDAGCLRDDLVLPSTDEFRSHLLRERRLEVEDS